MKVRIKVGLWAVIVFCVLILIFILRSTGSSADLKVVQHYSTTSESMAPNAQELTQTAVPPSFEKIVSLKAQNTATLYEKKAQFELTRSIASIQTTTVEQLEDHSFECLALIYFRGQKDAPLFVTTTYSLVEQTFVLTGIIY